MKTYEKVKIYENLNIFVEDDKLNILIDGLNIEIPQNIMFKIVSNKKNNRFELYRADMHDIQLLSDPINIIPQRFSGFEKVENDKDIFNFKTLLYFIYKVFNDGSVLNKLQNIAYSNGIVTKIKVYDPREGRDLGNLGVGNDGSEEDYIIYNFNFKPEMDETYIYVDKNENGYYYLNILTSQN